MQACVELSGDGKTAADSELTAAELAKTAADSTAAELTAAELAKTAADSTAADSELTAAELAKTAADSTAAESSVIIILVWLSLAGLLAVAGWCSRRLLGRAGLKAALVFRRY